MNEIVNVFDFNFVSPIGHNLPITDRKGLANAFRTNHLLSTHEFYPETRIQQMRSPDGIPTPVFICCDELAYLSSHDQLGSLKPVNFSTVTKDYNLWYCFSVSTSPLFRRFPYSGSTNLNRSLPYPSRCKCLPTSYCIWCTKSHAKPCLPQK